jgi:cation diffusion facilitator CzcD-associated flavoprotein CzcO
VSNADSEYRKKYCIVGAGPSGLTAAKNLLAAGIGCDVYEREDDVGGNWYFGKPASSVYRSTHLISSKRLTEFVDYPMPKSIPVYPNHFQVHEYMKDYARNFDLYEHIRFNTSIEQIEREGDLWRVTLSTGESIVYAGVVIANGHNWDPQQVEYPGEFQGTAIHSCEYKTPDTLAGKRVLVVGAGNSGCDIAVEASQQAAKTFHSTRRGYHYLPKFFRGKPIDQCNESLLRWRVPLWLRRLVTRLGVKIALGSPQDYGLPKPDHKLFETHPIINSQLLYHVGHGDITPKPDIERFDGLNIFFTDGTSEAIDVIVYAIGYRISFPFIDSKYLNEKDGCPRLFLNAFHPEYDNLFVVGLIQPDSGQWGLTDYQAQLVANVIGIQASDPEQAAKFHRLKQRPNPDMSTGIRYLRSTRHLLEVEHYSYRQRLKKLIAEFPYSSTTILS